MLHEKDGDPDRRKDFDAPQIESKWDDNEIGLSRGSCTKTAVDGAARSLPSINFADHLVRIPLWKRVLDVSCVLIAIPSLLPLILIVAALIKLTSKGPILFKQERVGFLGRKFTIFKFRTMTVGVGTAAHQMHVARLMEDNRPMIKLDQQGDERLIAVAPLLRALGLDELPQLINVLRGEMSIVGPRPCLPSEYNRYLPHQKERLHALPGLTGLWQTSGKNRLTFSEMIDYDIRYVRTQSLYLDLKIMLKTIPALIAEVKDMQRAGSSAGPARTDK